MAHRIQIFRDGTLLHDSDAERIGIGRTDVNDVALADDGVSRRHGEITATPAGLVYRDLRSSNGSEVRRGRDRFAVDAAAGFERPLEDGDELLVGDPDARVVLSLRISGAEPAAPPTPSPPADENVLRLGTLDLGDGMATILGVNRIDDVAAISLRLEDDKAALLCLYKLLKGVSGIRDTAGLFQTLGELVIDSFPMATHASIYLRNPASPEDFVPLLARTRRGPTAPTPASRTLLRRLLESREAIVFKSPESLGGAVSLISAKIQSGMVAPLFDEDEVRGFVQVDSRTLAGVFGEHDLDLLTLMGNQAALILKNLSMTEDLKLLNADLTSALNRIEVLNKAKEHLSKFVPETVRKKVESSPIDPGLNPTDIDATVLFLDIGGYTKLTEALEREKIIFLVEKYFSAFLDDIHEHGGDINEMAGDGLMIIFQHDDPMVHCRNAVRASVAIRRKTRLINGTLEGLDAIAVNMGINTGVVSIGAKKMEGISGSRWTFTATGMVTNVSARIGAYATNGMICVSPTTASRLGTEFRTKEHAPVQFKNVSQPMPVFEILDGLDDP